MVHNQRNYTKCYIDKKITLYDSPIGELIIGEDIWYQRDDKNLRISIRNYGTRMCFLHIMRYYWDSDMIQQIVNHTDKILFFLNSHANPVKHLSWYRFHVPVELELNNKKIVVATGDSYISDIGE